MNENENEFHEMKSQKTKKKEKLFFSRKEKAKHNVWLLTFLYASVQLDGPVFSCTFSLSYERHISLSFIWITYFFPLCPAWLNLISVFYNSSFLLVILLDLRRYDLYANIWHLLMGYTKSALVILPTFKT